MNFLRPPQLSTPELTERGAITWVVALLGLGSVLIQAFAYLLTPTLGEPDAGYLLYIVPELAALTATLFAIRRGHVTASAIVLVTLLFGLVGALTFFGGGLELGFPPLLAVIAIMSALMLGPRVGIALTLVTTGATIAVYAFGSSRVMLLQDQDLDGIRFNIQLVTVVAGGVLVNYAVYRLSLALQAEQAQTREAERYANELSASQVHLAEAKAEAEHAAATAREASASKSRFLANMSHELRTPLNAIIGYADLMLEDSRTDQDHEDLQRIRRSGQHLLALINDVLDMSKVEAGRMELHRVRTSVCAVLDEVEAVLEPAAKARGIALSVRCEVDGDGWLDDRKIRQILLNLASNGVKFTAKGRVDILGSLEGQQLCIEVRDTGIGIAPEALETIFDPFVQAEKRTPQLYGGTGLGLALSRRFSELLGGTLVVESELGVGSTFRLVIPFERATD